MAKPRIGAQLEVLLGALLFAASVPAGKLLLRDLPPLALSGGLYLSAGLSSAALWALLPAGDRATRLHGSDWRWLAAAVALGGVLAPLALFQGLQATSGHAAGLLLNLEALFTVLLGVLLYHERVSQSGLLGMIAILGGAVVLSWSERSGAGSGRVIGASLIAVACAGWAFDNALTQRISLRDAREITAIKGLVGGGTSLGLAAALGQLGSWTPSHLLGVLLVGSLSYGLSIMLFVRGLRSLGVVQTGAFFSLAPAMAAVLSWLGLREPLQAGGLLALAVMTGGAVLLSRDAHEHLHAHEDVTHVHEHEHDEHHQHEHAPGELARVPHVHMHTHKAVVHAHAHAHDVHHRHRH